MKSTGSRSDYQTGTRVLEWSISYCTCLDRYRRSLTAAADPPDPRLAPFLAVCNRLSDAILAAVTGAPATRATRFAARYGADRVFATSGHAGRRTSIR